MLGSGGVCEMAAECGTGRASHEDSVEFGRAAVHHPALLPEMGGDMSEASPNDPPAGGGGADLEHGLPMFSAGDPEALAREKAELVQLSTKPALARWRGYARKTGPGWLQSAMTLGGGSAAASLTAGALFGYKLLWVQPVAMILGIIMLSAMSYQ
ncbi:unnamed protein product, partial [marine sediment metagenome]